MFNPEKWPSEPIKETKIEEEKPTLKDVEFVIQNEQELAARNFDLAKTESGRARYADKLDFYNAAYIVIEKTARPWLEQNPNKDFDDFLSEQVEKRYELLQKAKESGSEAIIKHRQKDLELIDRMSKELNLGSVISRKEDFERFPVIKKEKKEEAERTPEIEAKKYEHVKLTLARATAKEKDYAHNKPKTFAISVEAFEKVYPRELIKLKRLNELAEIFKNEFEKQRKSHPEKDDAYWTRKAQDLIFGSVLTEQEKQELENSRKAEEIRQRLGKEEGIKVILVPSTEQSLSWLLEEIEKAKK